MLQTAREIHIHNKSDRPDNIVLKEVLIEEKCAAIEAEMPPFLRGYFLYLKGSLLPMSRQAYLSDLRFFLNYLIAETDLTEAKVPKDIRQADFARVESADINLYLDYLRKYKVKKDGAVYVYQNDNRSLARKRSSLSVLFKYLYRGGFIEKNITDGLDPIRLPRAGDREIKHLEDGEVMTMLDAAATGEGLTKKELQYWQKTKLRDRAMLLLFVTYGLRLSELRELNIDSFNFGRGEFKIYRKRGKEAMMPLSRTVLAALKAYIDGERGLSLTRGAMATAATTADTTAASGAPASSDTDALFLSLQGGRMTERQIRETVKKYTGIALGTGRAVGYSPHKLRATTATSLIERGNSIYDVQDLLNHDNITTTQLYAAHRKGAKRELIKDLEWDE